jgi:glycosyltransferase involved in cell wall biosynthesis
MPKPSITAIVLTRDEGLHIRRCIESLAPAVERICIVDSGSTDNTIAIARSLGAEVYANPWINYAAQFNWGLDQCNIATEWVLRLDADEYLEPELQAELVQRLPTLAPDIGGVLLKRKYFFLGHWVRHGGLHPLFHLRLWRTGAARIEQRWMDEHAVLETGRTIRFDGTFVDDNHRDLAWWSQKHIGYATREAVQVLLDELGVDDDRIAAEQSGKQASIKRWVKKNLYDRLPPGIGPLFYVVYRLVPRVGILDGGRGIAFHILQGFWYRLLVDLRRFELRREIAVLLTTDAKLTALEKITGLQIRTFQANRQPSNGA